MERHFEWLNRNSLRKYPIKENVTNSPLPDSFIVDLSLCVPETVDFPLYISKVHVTPGLVSVAIRNDTKVIAVASGQILDEKYFPIYFDSVDEVVSGALVVSDGVKDLVSTNQSVFILSKDQGEIEHGAIIETSTNFVREIKVEGSESSFTGDVVLEAGEGISINIDKESNSIILSANNPEAFLAECNIECRPEECNPPAIFAINEVLPDEIGLITFEGDAFVDPVGSGDTLVLSTPLLTPNDLCDNREGPSPGPPGAPGVPGAKGPDGVLILPGDPIPSGCQEVIIDGPDPLSPQNGGFVPAEEEDLVVLPNTSKFIASEDMSCGDAVSIKIANFVQKAKADSITTVPCIGFALNSVRAGDELLVQFAARIDLLGGLTPGEEHFVSPSDPGKITATPPSLSGQFSQVVGVAINEAILLIIFGDTVGIP